MSILLADDDLQLATFLSKSLESEGYSVRTAPDEETVLSELKRQNYKLIILDLNFGRTDGLKLLERLRGEGLATPIIVLSARNRVSDRIQSLNLGADDYVTKPFSFQELAARTNALLRRKTDPGLNLLRVENLELDPATRKVRRGQHEIRLSPREFDLLHLLMRHAGETVSRNILLQECWGHEADTDSNLVDVYINYLRKKIDSGNEPKLLFTIRGEGYRLGKPAPLTAASDREAYYPESVAGPGSDHPGSRGELPAVRGQNGLLRTLIHSMAHDLAQPLTSVRCFLEVLAMRKPGVSLQASEIKGIEQQADRAIALTRGISAMVRETGQLAGPWISLDALLNDVWDDFVVLVHSGFLSVRKELDPSIQVTSSPVLRQVLVLLAAKLTGRSTRPLTVSVSCAVRNERCHLQMLWTPNDGSSAPGQDARSILAKEQKEIEEMAHSIGTELMLSEDQPRVDLTLPAGPGASTSNAPVH